MTRRPRLNHTPAFKSKVALEAIKGEKTLSELAQQFDVHANQIKLWRDELLAGAQGVFSKEGKAAKPEPTIVFCSSARSQAISMASIPCSWTIISSSTKSRSPPLASI